MTMKLFVENVFKIKISLHYLESFVSKLIIYLSKILIFIRSLLPHLMLFYNSYGRIMLHYSYTFNLNILLLFDYYCLNK